MVMADASASVHPMRRLSVLALALAACGAEAGRPLQSEDAPVIDASACEIEGAYSDWRAGGDNSPQTYVQFGCGVGAQTELAVQLLKPREVGLAGKTRLLAAPWPHGEAALSLAWGLSQRRVDAGWRRSTTVINLAASLPVARDWVTHLMVGHQRDVLERRRSTNWALAVEHNGLGDEGRWQPMAEVFGDDHGRPWLNAALRFAVWPERAFVDASLGRRLGGGRAQLMTAGFKLAF
jgi:hypothetical protein